MSKHVTVKSLTGLLFFLTFWLTSVAQINLHSSDFNTSQGEDYTLEGVIGNTPWTVSRPGPDWGARIHNDILELTNSASDEANANGWVFAYLDAGEFVEPYNTVLGMNSQPVSWYFNMRQIRSNPAGFGSNSYGVAFVIGTDNTHVATAGSGYAIVLGNSGTPDPVRFVKFSGGIQTLGSATEALITATSPLDNPTNEYMSIGLTYDPATSTWELWGRLDGSSFEDPLVGELTSLGTVTDSEHTNIALDYLGAYWQGSTAAAQTAFFDNVSVWLQGDGSVPPSITNVVQIPSDDITPQTTVSVSADIIPGDAAVSAVELQWGLVASSLDNTIPMSAGNGQTYSTDSDIPGQSHNSSVYYRVQATDADDQTVVSQVFSYLVMDPSIDLVIVSVENPSTVTVDFGTLFGELPLPAQVNVTLDNDAVLPLAVNWLQDDYDGQTAGFYALQGELILEEGIVNPENFQAEIGVVVLEEIFMPENVIIGYTFPEAEDPGANLGETENLGNPITREEGFEGNYSYPTGITGQSISATGWNEGDGTKYWMTGFSTLGFSDLLVSSAQQSSNTGPRDFKLQYRIAQGEWQDVADADITVANNFTSGVLLQVPLPEEMEEKAQVYLRWIMTSNTSVNGNVVSSAGTGRIDHIFVEGVESGFVPNVVSVEALQDIQVEQGTAFEQVDLPEMVAVTLNNNQVVDMDVIWSEGDYDGDVLGDYLITGELILPDGITNDDDIQAQVIVSVAEEILVLNIVSIHVIDQVIIVDQGTLFEDIPLPNLAEVTLENDSVVQLEVIWMEVDYDGSQPGLYPLEGEVVLVSGIGNPDNLMAEIFVEVLEIPQEIIVAGWTFPENTQGADQGTEGNIGKFISREPGFDGTYSWLTGASGDAISTTQWVDGQGVKYWMIEISTIGYGELTLSSKQRGSNTGPRDFKIQYRIGQTGDWTDVENSSITVDNNFTTGVLNDLPLPAACNNKAFLYLRWVMDSDISVNGGDIAGAGTSRIDDVFVKGVFSSDFKRIVTGVETPEALTVEIGTAYEELNLPETVTVTFDDTGTENLQVIWDEGDFDGDATGVYQLTGEIQLEEGMENPDNITAIITVEVVPEVQIYTVTFRVDMSNAPGFDPDADQVFISGSMFNFAIPGTLPDEQLMEPAGNLIYTNTLELEEGNYLYRYYINEGVGNPEPGSDRNIQVLSDTIIHDFWGVTNLDEVNDISLSVYPNPASTYIEVSAHYTIHEITITDIRGLRLMRQPVMNRSFRLSLADYPAGMYFVTVITDEGMDTRKVIVRR